MSYFEQFSCRQLIIAGHNQGAGIRINVGSAATRALALAADPSQPIGSRYYNTTAGITYVRVARTAGDATATDMEKVTTSAAD